MKNFKLITLGYRVPPDHLDAMVAALDKQEDLVKIDSGKDDEGHAITFKYREKDVFFAMIHSSGKGYLVRAMKGLLTEI